MLANLYLVFQLFVFVFVSVFVFVPAFVFVSVFSAVECVGANLYPAFQADGAASGHVLHLQIDHHIEIHS